MSAVKRVFTCGLLVGLTFWSEPVPAGNASFSFPPQAAGVSPPTFVSGGVGIFATRIWPNRFPNRFFYPDETGSTTPTSTCRFCSDRFLLNARSVSYQIQEMQSGCGAEWPARSSK